MGSVSPAPASRRGVSLFGWLLIGLSLFAVGAYLYVAVSRMTYPFSLEWLESNTFVQVLRVIRRQPLYAPPGYDFIPLLYTPFYYYLTAVVALASQQIMLSMRLVSIFASMLVFISIYGICRARKLSAWVSIAAVGIFAASYAKTGFWFDIGKMDSLFLALLLCAYWLVFVRAKRERIFGAWAGMFIFLSFATKQQALFAVPFMLFYLIVERRWMKAVWMGVTFLVCWLAYVFVMNGLTHGWFWFYIYAVPSAHPVSWEIVTRDFWTLYILPAYAWMVLLIVLAGVVLLVKRDRVGFFRYAFFLYAFTLPLSIMSVFSVAHQYGWINNLFPIVAALSVSGAQAYHYLACALNSEKEKTRVSSLFYFLASMILLLQFSTLRYDPRAQIPTLAEGEAGDHIVDLLGHSRSPIFVPTSPDLLYKAGRPVHFQASSMGDLALAAQLSPAVRDKVQKYLDTINNYIAENTIQTAFLPDANWYDQIFSFENGYLCESLVGDYLPLKPVTGVPAYPSRVCRRQAEETP